MTRTKLIEIARGKDDKSILVELRETKTKKLITDMGIIDFFVTGFNQINAVIENPTGIYEIHTEDELHGHRLLFENNEYQSCAIEL